MENFAYRVYAILYLISPSYLEPSELIVVSHHSIADGTAIAYLIRDILQAIAEPIALVEPLAVPPSREDLVAGASETIASFKLMHQFSRMSNSFANKQHPRQNDRQWVSSNSLSPAITQLLIARSRQEQTSVHAAICAAFLLALRHQNHSKQPQTLSSTSPIGLRPYLPVANSEDLSLRISAGRTSHQLSADTNLWDVARSVKHQLKQMMVPDKLFERIAQEQEWASTHPSPDVVLQTFKEHLGYDICVSNLTRLPIQQQFGTIALQAIYGPVVRTGVATDRLVGVATLGDQLFSTFVASELVMSRSEAKTLHDQAMHLLNEAIQSDQ